MNTPFEKVDGIEQSNVESSLSGLLSIEPASDDASQDVIPDLDLVTETEEDHKESVSKPLASKESDPTEVLQELGELRFADEN